MGNGTNGANGRLARAALDFAGVARGDGVASRTAEHCGVEINCSEMWPLIVAFYFDDWGATGDMSEAVRHHLAGCRSCYQGLVSLELGIGVEAPSLKSDSSDS